MNNVAIIDRKARMQISSRCHANDWFKKYRPETERTVKDIDVKKDKVIESLKNAFVADWFADVCREDRNYVNALKVVRSLRYSPEAITGFSIVLSEFNGKRFGDYCEFNTRMGLFLSALINNCDARDFTVITTHMDSKIWCLGYKNTKNILVEGNTGDKLGMRMKGGEITVKGDADGNIGDMMNGGKIIVKGNLDTSLDCSGGAIIIESDADRPGARMHGGIIVVKGNAKNAGDNMQNGQVIIEGDAETVGEAMRGGIIVIKGNAGDVGSDMGYSGGGGKSGIRRFAGEGGTIYLNGDYKSINSHMHGGNIYHKGKLIVRWGRKI